MDTITSPSPTGRILDGLHWLGSLPLPSPMGVHVNSVYGYGLDGDGDVDVHLHPQDAEQLREVRRLVGKVDKQESATGLKLKASPVAGVTVTIHPPSGTCERVQVGTRTVTRQEPVGEVEYREVEVEEPVYGWECPPSVLAEEVPA